MFPTDNLQIQIPFFYILDIRNFTWITQFEPELPPNTNTTIITSTTVINTSPVEKSDNKKQIAKILNSLFNSNPFSFLIPCTLNLLNSLSFKGLCNTCS